MGIYMEPPIVPMKYYYNRYTMFDTARTWKLVTVNFPQ